MLKKIANILGIVLVLVFIAGTFAFTSINSKEVKCTSIEFSFNEKDQIKANTNELMQLIRSADSKILSKTMNKINCEEIEAEVKKHKAVRKAEVYKIISREDGEYKGHIVVKIKHRKPVLRVLSESGNYYLDREGNRVPVSPNYSANVMVVTGRVSEDFAREQILPFILFLEDDDFWNAQIEQLHVEQSGDVLITPLIGDHIIELGSMENYEAKLRKMRAFYDQVLIKSGWKKYRFISLKYDNQVIAKK